MVSAYSSSSFLAPVFLNCLGMVFPLRVGSVFLPLGVTLSSTGTV